MKTTTALGCLLFCSFAQFGQISQASPPVVIKPGSTAEISYPFPYKGLFIEGTSTFIFSVEVDRLNADDTKALVKVSKIKRYWDKELRENDIAKMPFTDPRGYKQYPAPSDWGKSVKIGDTAWISTDDLKNMKGATGTTTETGKAEAAAGDFAGKLKAGFVETIHEKGHYEYRQLDCPACGGKGYYYTIGGNRPCSTCGGKGTTKQGVFIPDPK